MTALEFRSPEQPDASATEPKSLAAEGATHLTPAYRPDIDGLRAIAVLAVLGFHAFPAWVPGGFAGVDVFFVISGYLISTILFANLERGSFSFFGFYARRVRRIFPALIVVLLACLAAGWFTLFSIEYTQLGKHVAGSAGFVSNFLLWAEAGYFDKTAEIKPLLHIWSLGIEEQFYIVWPLLLYLTWKRRIGSLTFLLILLVSSFALNVLLVGSHQTAAYYFPLTRFWELSAGAILAYFALPRASSGVLQSDRTPMLRAVGVIATQSAAMNNIKAATGLVLVALAVLLPDQAKGYPGWWALLPVAGTSLLLSAGPDAWIGRSLLATRAMVAIGLISYPLYLWHWPLLSFSRIIEGHAPSADLAALLLLASVALASFTYLLIEKPLRTGRLPLAKVFWPLVALMGAIGLAGLCVYEQRGFASRFPVVEDILTAAEDYEHGQGIEEGRPGAPETFLLGDSTMGQYVPRVHEIITQRAIDLERNRIVVRVLGGCLPIPDIAQRRDAYCAEFVDEVLAAAEKSTVRTVAIAALWTNHFTQSDYYLRSDGPDHLLKDSEAAKEHAYGNFAAFISGLVKSGKQVFVLLETPQSLTFEPTNMLPTGLGRLAGQPKIPPSLSRADMEEYNGKIDAKIAEIAEAAGAKVIKPMDYLCDDAICPAFTKEGRLMYFNYDHLRASYVRNSATWMDEIFDAAANPTPSK